MDKMNNSANANPLTEAQELSLKMMCNCQTPIVKNAWSEYADTLENLGQNLQKIPALYAQDGKGFDAIVYAHYFAGSTDIFVTEREDDELFTYTILNGDCECAEFGHQILSELKSIGVLNLDFHWEQKTLRQALKETSDYYEDL